MPPRNEICGRQSGDRSPKWDLSESASLASATRPKTHSGLTALCFRAFAQSVYPLKLTPMSQSSHLPVSCPQCGHSQAFTSWHSINVARNPEKKAELKNGSLTRFTCTNCQNQTELNYPILYHDPAQQFMIWMKGDGDEAGLKDLLVGDFLKDYRLRLVDSRNQLIEKSHVFDHGLDDRLLELFKVVVKSNNKSLPEGDLLFAGMGTGQSDAEELQFAVLSAGGTRFIGTNRQAYEDFAQQLTPVAQAQPLAAGQWHRIDQAFAADLVARFLPNAGL